MDLMDLKLENLLGYDPDTKSFRGNPPIGYYRQPLASEYPLDLGRGFNQFIPRNGNFPRAFSTIQHHVLHLREPRQLLNNTDFFLNRGTMLMFMGDRTFRKEMNFAACRFKGCIYVRSLWEDFDERPPFVPRISESYSYKARQYVFTRSPGEPPNLDAPVDQRKQIYGIFTAKLGDLRLLYSAEVSGVSNTEPLGDLDDPEVLKKCQLASLRLKFNTTDAMPLWLMQAYLGGIDHLAIAVKTESGCVCQPIEVVSSAMVIRKIQFNIHDRLKAMHNILQKISMRMGEEDDPTKELKFQLGRGSILFADQFESVQPPGHFDQQFIDLTNQLYSPM
ncbi:uncharacterized protein LOC111076055 [Drosophila obscura]|uniref:uncharacterized protein LOC111076055 n=1 Tax=Drosophila obscura TaxID=7282 RepID=UPI001BB17139|nr:uncharacterized protein LOC111076055 [Drosophila obscura]